MGSCVVFVRMQIATNEPFGEGIIFFLILAHPVYKMWIIQEPNKLALWNKLNFEKKNIQYLYLLNKYIKCNIWRLAVRYDPYMGR